MVSLTDVMEHQNKQCGDGTVAWGTDMKKDPPRIPTGVFAVDYATGGGLPVWGSTCFWGKESGGKTSLALNTVQQVQSICWTCYLPHEMCACSTSPLRMKAYWGDAEGTLDRDWAEQIGVNSAQYMVGLADYGEQHVNIADNALKADDCGLIVIDSLAALTPSAEMDALEEQQFIGLQARLVTRAVRKLKQRLITERKNGHPCSILFTNQLRIKIGQAHGSPETMAGGHGMHHEFSLLLRIISKSLKRDGVDKKYVGKEQEHAVRHSFAVRKAKVLTLASTGEFVRAKHEMKGLGLAAGEIDDYNTLMNYAREYGVVTKGNKTYGYRGKRAKRLDDIKQVWKKHRREYVRTGIDIIQAAKERLGGECVADRDEEGQADA